MPGVLALLTSLTLTGCGTLENRLKTAATEQGRVAAKPAAPVLPEDCRLREPHAALVPGADARSVLKRERRALDRANDRVIRCADLTDDLLEHL